MERIRTENTRSQQVFIVIVEVFNPRIELNDYNDIKNTMAE
jgi:hypothetical protein